MKPNIFFRCMTVPLLLTLAVAACGGPTSEPTSPPETEPTATEEIQIEPEDTDVPQTEPTPTVKVVQQEVTSGPESSCTVVQDVNLRKGPSRAYRPRIRLLAANSVVTPLGFLPKGLVDGTWAYVLDRASQDEGWVSAGPEFLNCDIDLASLPPTDYDLPEAYTPSTAQVSPGPGTCGQGGVTSDNQVDVYDCDVVISDGFPVQFIILKNGQEAGQADGVQNVVFSVTQNDNEIYNITENQEAYCVFGGTAPCGSWILENYFYKWEPGGAVLESGVYTLNIVPTLDDPSVNLFWSADITVALPP